MKEVVYTEAQVIDFINQERERIIAYLSRTEFTSLDHMPHEAAINIRADHNRLEQS